MLFQEFLSPQEAEALIDDENNPEWTSPALGEKVKVYLGRRYGTFCEAVGEIKDAINSLSDALDTNVEVGDGREKVSAIELSARPHFPWPVVPGLIA